jgi:hypothetical protein
MPCSDGPQNAKRNEHARAFFCLDRSGSWTVHISATQTEVLCDIGGDVVSPEFIELGMGPVLRVGAVRFLRGQKGKSFKT